MTLLRTERDRKHHPSSSEPQCTREVSGWEEAKAKNKDGFLDISEGPASFCVGVRFTCKHASMFICIRACLSRWRSKVSLRYHSSGAINTYFLFCFETESHWDPRLINLSRLADWQTPGIHLFPPPQVQNYKCMHHTQVFILYA